MTRSSAATSSTSQPAPAEQGPVDPEPERPLRKDAQRNRDLLLSVASEQFTQHGVDVPLEDVARQAGVGIGTLYRHFPTRALLIEAVYRREVAQLCDSVDELLATMPPDQALEAWMRNFVTYVATKRGLSAALKDMMDSEPDLFTATRASIYAAAGTVLGAAVEAGDIRPDIEPEDLIRAMSGICMVTDDRGFQDRATRLMSLLLDGLRFGAPLRTR